MIQKEINLQINQNINDNFLNFSFANPNNLINENEKINTNILEKEINNKINDEENIKIKNNNIDSIFKSLNKNEIEKDNFPFYKQLNKNTQSNLSTKSKIGLIYKRYNSPYNKDKNINNENIQENLNNNKDNILLINNNNNIKKNFSLFNFNSNIDDNKIKIKKELKKLFNIKDNEKLPYEIEFILDNNPKFNYDFEHQNDNNSNFQYINENFLDILLLSYKKKLILNSTIKPLKEIQKEITFSKRNILISWLTEINFKYIKDQNILFTAIKFLDTILYKENININDFQLIGILCFNLSLKMENFHKSLIFDEIISLIGEGGDKNKKNRKKIIKKIIKYENIIVDILNFDLEISTSVLILNRLVQMLNIKNKKAQEIFYSIAYFFLEISLYDEQFYEIEDFDKALSSLLMTKEILKINNYRIGFHSYLINCSKIKKKEIKYYITLCKKVIKELKSYKYGITIFIKYQHKDFHHVMNIFLNNII